MLVCEAALGGSPAPPQGGGSTPAGITNSTSNSGSAQGAPKGSGGKEEGSATLLQYCRQLPDVRVADEGTSKDVLALLFQLVQMQIRKAEKFREVRLARYLPLLTHFCMSVPSIVIWSTSTKFKAGCHLGSQDLNICVIIATQSWSKQFPVGMPCHATVWLEAIDSRV